MISLHCFFLWLSTNAHTRSLEDHQTRCRILSDEKPAEYNPHNLRVHPDYGRHRFNPSGHLRNIYHKLWSKYYKLERRALFKSRWYNLPMALYTHGKAHKVIQYEGHCRIKSNKGTDGPQGIWCEHRYSTRGRRMQGDLVIETTD